MGSISLHTRSAIIHTHRNYRTLTPISLDPPAHPFGECTYRRRLAIREYACADDLLLSPLPVHLTT